MNTVSSETVDYLCAHGVSAAPGSPPDGAAVFSCLRDAYPAGAPLSENGAAYLSALLDCLGALEPQLYHTWRPVADLLYRFVMEAAPSADPGDPLWQRALSEGDRLGVIDPDQLSARPHKNDAGKGESAP